MTFFNTFRSWECKRPFYIYNNVEKERHITNMKSARAIFQEYILLSSCSTTHDIVSFFYSGESCFKPDYILDVF